MNRLVSIPLKYIFIVSISISVSGCSWLTSFVVQNNSKQKIEIEYSLCCQESRFWYSPPKQVENSNFGYNKPNWNDIPEAVHFYDENKGIVTVSILPNHSVLVNTDINYMGYSKDENFFFKLSALTIKSPEGKISFEGKELAKSFKKESKNLYVLKYE